MLAPRSDVLDAGYAAPFDESAGNMAPDASASSDAGASTDEPTLEGEADVAGDSCAIRTVDLYGAVPEMLIVLDRSLSMSLNRRWEPSKQAVKTISLDYGGLLRFGVSLFPGANGDCAAGQLDVPLAIANSSAIANLVDHTQTSGLTPTGPALTQALRILGDRRPAPDTMVRPAYVLLVTDGAPNCQALPLFPDSAQQDAARAAVRALKDKNIATYVIGYQIESSYQSMMNELAQLGGTARYRAVENAEQIVATFREITKDVVACSFDFDEASDPRFVRVEIDDVSIPLDASDGFSIQGSTITLKGAACAALRDGRGHTVNAQVECREVVLD